MAASILELTTDIVSSHASASPMSSDELVQEIQKVYAALQDLEAGKVSVAPGEAPEQPAMSVRAAFRKNEVICMICGKGGMKALTRHLSTVHNLKPGQYRKQFGIPREQPLTAKSYSEARRKMAEERGLGDLLAKGREKRAAKLKGKKVEAAKPAKSAKVVKKSAPAKPARTTKAKPVKK